MSTTIAPGAAARPGAAPAREQAAAASASRAGRARGWVPRPDNHVIVVFGATGDLAHRKLLPGLFHLAAAGLMPDRYQIIGVSPQDMTGEQFRDLARRAIAEFGKVKPAGAAWEAFARRLSFASADPAHTLALARAIAAAERQVGGSPGRLLALTDAVRVEQVLATNPAERAKLPRTRRGEPGTIWTTGQLAAFLEQASTHRLYAFFRLAAYTGARRGELLALRWAALDLDAAEVTLRGSTDVIDGERVEDTTKSGRSRVVSLDAGTVAVIREHRRRQLEERMKAGPLWVESGFVFTAEDGTLVFPDTVTILMRKFIRDYNEPAVPGRGRGRPRMPLPRPDAPLPPARLHDLRHVHATTLLLAGVPVHVVATRLGHADPSTTLRVYAHVLRDQAAGAADVFARAIEAAVSNSVSK